MANLDLENISGVGPSIKNKLNGIGIFNSRDLCFHLPINYQDRTRVKDLAGSQVGDEIFIECKVVSCQILYKPRKMMIIKAADKSRSILIRFFYFNPGQAKQFKANNVIRFYGILRLGRYGLEMIHPEYQMVESEDSPTENYLTAVYRATKGLSQNQLRKFIGAAIEAYKDSSEEIDLQKYGLSSELSLIQALKNIHFPTKDIAIENIMPGGQHPARQRLVKEEMIAFQLGMASLKDRQAHLKAPPLEKQEDWYKSVLNNFPHVLTGAQEKVVNEIQEDISNHVPMMRLVQGDVGSGKTIVAAIAAAQSIDNNVQVAFMAPTTLLAEQHYLNLKDYFPDYEDSLALLTSATKAKDKERIKKALLSGSIKLVIGTHALFQDDISFSLLGLIIIDEQHRFGVNQRLSLRSKNTEVLFAPHQLTLTATPIPRTMAMSVYANMSISVIDELPPGRLPIKTTALSMNKKDELISRIGKACIAGSQVYWVCALIEESEMMNANPIEETFDQIKNQIPSIKTNFLHGKMKAEDKLNTVNAFKRGETKILISTTVIEVGVDVPSADIMIIENAERFGLAQLHQLRGRIGRGTKQSHCILLHNDFIGDIAKQRIEILKESSDGFYIAEKDLLIRGPGEIMGSQQTGVIPFKYTDLMRDSDYLEETKLIAEKIYSTDKENSKKLIQRWLSGSIEFADA
ncbi:MAG: ATP-dependent DNA helicase RecG [SAR86 cluster bacterium]|uniref:ATP-dependent DNA helicase RecG n=1 Tax=SAR86 cluster bacterium TaxID=2030880 RepID=A0A520M9X5_9GAMM|nr:MAG: ATP-dependent DNA helicase RecG [SAR86 cluster bacterium]